MYDGNALKDRNNYRVNLISLVKANPMLWDKTAEDFNNRTAKVEKWLELSKLLDVSTDKMRRTWENLRDQYRRDLKRRLVYGSKSKWRLYDEMNFIRKMVRIKEPTAGNSDNDNEQDATADDSLKNEISVDNIASMLEANLETAAINAWLPAEMTHGYQHELDTTVEEKHQLLQQPICDCTDEANLELSIPDMVKIEIGSSPHSPENAQTQNDFTPVEIAPNISEAYVSTSSTSQAGQKRFKREHGQNPIQNATVSHYDNSDQQYDSNRFCAPADQTNCSEPQDEDYHFVMSILPSLRQVGSKRKLFLRMGIMNMVSQELQREEQ